MIPSLLLLACADPCPDLDYSNSDAVLRVTASPNQNSLVPPTHEAALSLRTVAGFTATGNVALGDWTCLVVPADTPVEVTATTDPDLPIACEGTEWEEVPAGEVRDLDVEVFCGFGT